MTGDAEDYTEEPSDADLVRRGDGRRFKNLCRKLRDDMGGTLNVGQKWLVRRCVQITLELEKLEQARNRGKEIDLVLFGQLTDRLGRTLQRLGLEPDRATTPTAGFAFVVMANPEEPEPVDVTPIEHIPAPAAESKPELLSGSDSNIQPLTSADPAPLTSEQRMVRHDQEMAAVLAAERAKAAQRPASPWASFADNEIMNSGPRITDWADRRR
jgi:hypothetical protein